MICRKTMEECKTPSMCAPFQGCEAGQPDETAKLRQRIAELEGKLSLEHNSARDWMGAKHYNVTERLWNADEYDCLHMNLDDQGIHREDESGQFSIWGRVQHYARAARLQGFEAAREMAAKELKDAWSLRQAEFAIRAMQPPAEWGGAQNGQNTHENPVVTGNGVVTDWPHPDGFAGGLTERRIDDGEGEESKKAT